MGRRIGVLGGSFDPLHYGHLILADQIRQDANLDKVVLIPAYVSPFKTADMPAEGHHRLEMLKIAAEGHPGFEISDIELKKDGPSYTYDTLAELKKTLPVDDEIYFIMGTDTFMHISEWKMSEELIRNFGFIIGLRKGYDEEALEKYIEDLKSKYPLNAEYIRIPELEISSTDIKQRIREGKSVRFLLPDGVIEYIKKNGLYTNIKDLVRIYAKQNEKPTRYMHTCGVVKMAKELAVKHGVDPEKAEIAAWFHDAFRSAGNLEHGPIAADKLKELFGVEDEDILNAIRFHTTGRPGMSKLEMVLKVADQLEEGRDYPGVEEMREFLKLDIYRCTYELMVHTRMYVESIGGKFDTRSNRAIEWLREQFEGGQDGQ